MRIPAVAAMLAGSAAVGGCVTTVAPPPPLATAQVCGSYGYIDRNNDGIVTAAEWNGFRTGAYGYWDINRDGRVSQSEFQRCYAGGGFIPANYYNANSWNHYWSAFDANRDGYLSASEYWSAQAWTSVDRNRNGVLDSNEWNWWDL